MRCNYCCAWHDPHTTHVPCLLPCVCPPVGSTAFSLLTVPQTKKRRREESQAEDVAPPPLPPAGAADGNASSAAPPAAEGAAGSEGGGDAAAPVAAETPVGAAAPAKRMRLGQGDDVSSRVQPQLAEGGAEGGEAPAAADAQPQSAPRSGGAHRRCPLPPSHYVLTLEQLQVRGARAAAVGGGQQLLRHRLSRLPCPLSHNTGARLPAAAAGQRHWGHGVPRRVCGHTELRRCGAGAAACFAGADGNGVGRLSAAAAPRAVPPPHVRHPLACPPSSLHTQGPRSMTWWQSTVRCASRRRALS